MNLELVDFWYSLIWIAYLSSATTSFSQEGPGQTAAYQVQVPAGDSPKQHHLPHPLTVLCQGCEAELPTVVVLRAEYLS